MLIVYTHHHPCPHHICAHPNICNDVSIFLYMPTTQRILYPKNFLANICNDSRNFCQLGKFQSHPQHSKFSLSLIWQVFYIPKTFFLTFATEAAIFVDHLAISVSTTRGVSVSFMHCFSFSSRQALKWRM